MCTRWVSVTRTRSRLGAPIPMHGAPTSPSASKPPNNPPLPLPRPPAKPERQSLITQRVRACTSRGVGDRHRGPSCTCIPRPPPPSSQLSFLPSFLPLFPRAPPVLFPLINSRLSGTFAILPIIGQSTFRDYVSAPPDPPSLSSSLSPLISATFQP